MKIGVLGCAGRMGRTVMAEVLGSADLQLAGGVEQPGHAALGQDLGLLAGVETLGIVATDDARALLGEADVVIEFSAPEASVAHARTAAELSTGHVIGTTGLSEARRQRSAKPRGAPRSCAPPT